MAKKKKKQTAWQKKFSAGFTGGKVDSATGIASQDQSASAKARRRKARQKRS